VKAQVWLQRHGLTGAHVPQVDFEAFTKVLNRPGGFRDPGEPEEYCRGFQVFDKDMTGFIGVGQLRYSGSFFS
jgi:Ca2+-binding EF-hand superfamily protein